MTKVINVSLEEIVKLENLRDKGYLIREIDKDVNGCLTTSELQCRGYNDEGIYVSSQIFSRAGEREKICLDPEGLPYYQKTLGPITYNIYEKIFLYNTGFGSAMAHLNQKLLLEILKEIKQKDILK